MFVRKVEKDDLVNIKKWYEMHNQPDQTEFLSDLGFIVPNIAAAFLYTTNSKLCLFESFISNPNTTKEQRKEALDLISEQLLETAKYMNFKAILSLSDSESTEKRCLNYGFKQANFKPFLKVLSE